MSSRIPDIKAIQRLLVAAFPTRRVATTELLSGGFINTNLKVTFDTSEAPVVLRLYKGDRSVCQKEIEVLRLVHPLVPVPEVLYAEPNGIDGSGPFSVLEFVEGYKFQELKRTKNSVAIREAAASVGETLATIGKYTFEKPGRLTATANELRVGDPYVEGENPIPRILDQFLESSSLQSRLNSSLMARLHEFVWHWAPDLPSLEQRQLVHSDFGNRNILLRQDNERCKVAGVLDWEFAFSGSPLLDVGHFLRYEREEEPIREPWFSRAFVEHGGWLVDDWGRIVRVIDLTGLVDCLTHDYLPNDVVQEIVGLIQATLNECQP